MLNTLLLPISFTAPIFFSFDQAPLFIKWISFLNPLTYQLNAMRDLNFEIANQRNLITMLVTTFLITAVAIYSIKNAELTTNER
ncbi:ABC transporter permease [Streptococcus danieliae]|uniref:ABC transporter permease n=1 Tax=Streptococcus danieliae TaxID=747656 RepID=UPI0035A1314F